MSDIEDLQIARDEREKQILSDFYDKLLNNVEPMPPEFSKLVDEHFWELI